jgi:hypothetical protein
MIYLQYLSCTFIALRSTIFILYLYCSQEYNIYLVPLLLSGIQYLSCTFIVLIRDTKIG